MYAVKQSTALTVPFFVHDAAGDAVTGLTDGSFTKRISKNGAAFGVMTVTITEMENGWYSIPLSTSHSDTLGLLTVVFTNAGAKQVNLQWRVEARLADDLAYPTVSGRSLDVTATGAAGIDWGNVENPATAVDLSATDIQLADTVTTLTGHTPQTGDTFALANGANGFVATKADTAAILLDTGTDGVVVAAASKSGYSLTAATGLGNQTADITGSLSGSVGSVTGAVGSVTGAVGSVTTGVTISGTKTTLDALNDLASSDVQAALVTAGLIAVQTTIATLASQTSFTLTAGSTDDNAYNGALAIVTDSVTATQRAVGLVSAYTGATKTVTLAADPAVFLMAAGDSITILPIPKQLPSTLVGAEGSALGTTMRGTDSALLAASAPTNFSALSITAGGLVDITQAAADKVWSTAARLLTAGTNIVLAKGVGITGFNDLSAAQVNAEVDNALDTAIPGVPTANSINQRIAAIDDLTQAAGGGDLAAILADTADMQPKLGTPAGASMSADIAAVKSDTAAVLTDTADMQPKLGAPAGASISADIAAVKTDTAATLVDTAAQEALKLQGTASGVPTATTMVSDIGVTVDDQFKGRVIIFAADTTTAALRNQATDITGCTAATNTLTFTALTTAPVSGDTFTIV